MTATSTASAATPLFADIGVCGGRSAGLRFRFGAFGSGGRHFRLLKFFFGLR